MSMATMTWSSASCLIVSTFGTVGLLEMLREHAKNSPIRETASHGFVSHSSFLCNRRRFSLVAGLEITFGQSLLELLVDLHGCEITLHLINLNDVLRHISARSHLEIWLEFLRG